MLSTRQKTKSPMLQVLDHETLEAVAGGASVCGYSGVYDEGRMMCYETRNYSCMPWSSWSLNQSLP